MNRHLATVLALAVAASLRAQDPTPTPTPAPAPVPAPTPTDPPAADSRDHGKLEERARTMRDQIDNGKQVKSHVRVAVRLKNGNKLTGVVKDGRFVERVDGLRFVDAQAKDRGAGIRLWYTSGVRNWLFVPFSDFADYQVLQRLTPKQLEEMEHEMQLQEGRHAEREAQAERTDGSKPPESPPAEGDTVDAPTDGAPPAPGQEPAKPKTKKGKDDGGVTEAKPDKQTEEQRLWFSLLQAYPPAAGWGKARRDEISRRLAVVGSKPSETELKFVEQFAEWEKACAHFAVDTEPKPAEEPAPVTEPKGKKKEKPAEEAAPPTETKGRKKK